MARTRFDRHCPCGFIINDDDNSGQPESVILHNTIHSQYCRTIVGLEVMGSVPGVVQPEELSRRGLSLYQWYVVHGQAVFVRQACSDEEHVYYSTRQGLLLVEPADTEEEGIPMRTYCHPAETKPFIWKRMQQLVYHIESASFAGQQKDLQDGITVVQLSCQ
jgi:hypothetical protein